MLGVTILIVAFLALVFVTAKLTRVKVREALTPDLRASRSIRWIVILAWAACTVPSLIQNLTTGRRANAVADMAASTQSAALAAYGATFLLLVLCASQILTSRVATNGRGVVGVVLILLPWSMSVISSLAAGVALPYNTLALPLVAIALWRLNAKLEDLVPVAWLTGLTATVALLMGLLLPSRGLLHGSSGHLSTADKAIIGDTLLAGPFNHSNQLGVVLALGLPAVLLLSNKKARFWITAATVLALAWSASRGSLVAVAVGIVAVFLVSMFDVAGRRALARLVVIACAAVVVYVPLTTDTLAAYSDRGQIWRASLAGWEESPLFGKGYVWYSAMATVRNDLTEVAFNGHNLFVHAAVTGGIALLLALVLLCLRMASVSGSVAGEGKFFAMAYSVGFFAIAVLEVPSRFRDLDPTAWVSLLPLAVLLMQNPVASGLKSPAPKANRSLRPYRPATLRP